MSASNTKQFKVVLLGEGCVGKTSLVLRYCQNTFNDHHLSTLQVSFYVFDFVTTLVIENLLDYSWFLVCIKLEDGFKIINIKRFRHHIKTRSSTLEGSEHTYLYG